MLMKIIKITILIYLILASSTLFGCRKTNKNDQIIIIENIVNNTIQSIVELSQENDDKIDSIYLICDKPLTFLDAVNKANYTYGCSEFDLINSKIKIVSQMPDLGLKYDNQNIDFESRLFNEDISKYLFISIDTILVEKNIINLKSEFGRIGVRYIFKFEFDKSSLKLVRKALLRIIHT